MRDTMNLHGRKQKAGIKPRLLSQPNGRIPALGLSLLSAVVVFTITCLSGATLYVRAMHALKLEVRDNLIRTAQIAAGLVDGDMHQTFRRPQQEMSSAYTNALKPLAQVQKSHGEIKYIYTCTLKQGKVYFVLDPTAPGTFTAEGTENKSHIMQPYPEAQKEVILALRSGKAQADTEPTRDAWGMLLSGFAPIHDSSGRCVGIVGVDLTADRYVAHLAAMRQAARTGLFFAIVLSLMTGVFVFIGQRRLLRAQDEMEARVEEELAHALQERENIMETVPDILFRLDLGGHLVQWNRKLEFATGRSAQDLRGISPVELFPAAERELIIDAITQGFSKGYVEVEGTLLGLGNTSAPYQFRGVPLRDADGQVIGLTGTGRDITESKRQQAQLAESEQRYRSLSEHSPEGILVYSENRIVYANPAAATLFSADGPEDLLGRLIFDLVHPDDHILTRERARRSQEEGRPSMLQEQKYVRLDGQVIDVEAVSTPIIFQGKRSGQVLIRDITKRKQAEAQIRTLNANLSAAYDATIEGWARALDLRDHETEGHSRRVTEMTLRLAREIGMTEEELVHVRRGALLHDIGKMGVPDSILLKPGPLDSDEWLIMRRHPKLACEMLLPITFLNPVLDIPGGHHEKWDGTGYPCGLVGEEIPLAARLFAIVDVWDALRSNRPYRAAWPEERVIDHIHSLSGSHFDPQVVGVFMTLLAAEDVTSNLETNTVTEYQLAA